MYSIRYWRDRKYFKIGDEYSGSLIPIENNRVDINKTVAELVKYVQDLDFYAHKCSLAKENFKRFEVSKIAKDYMCVFNRVIGDSWVSLSLLKKKQKGHCKAKL